MDSDFMNVISAVMQGVWQVFDSPVHMPEPIGTITPGTIILFFATGGILADTILGVSERRD